MVRWLRWHCPPDTGFEIRALAVWGRVRYLSVTEAPHNTDFHTWMGKKHFCFFETAETGNRTPNSGVKGSGANHYPRAPAPAVTKTIATSLVSSKLDYCNSILSNIPNREINKVQSVQNCLARIVTRSPRFCSVYNANNILVTMRICHKCSWGLSLAVMSYQDATYM